MSASPIISEWILRIEVMNSVRSHCGQRVFGLPSIHGIVGGIAIRMVERLQAFDGPETPVDSPFDQRMVTRKVTPQF